MADRFRVGGAELTPDNTFKHDSNARFQPAMPQGGTAGQVLTKNSDKENDADWKDPQGGESEQITALWQAHNTLENKVNANAAVSEVRIGADYGGIHLHCVNTGNVYSYFTGEVLIESAIEIPPGEQFVFADENDFPELALYQGVGLLETGHALTVDMTAGTITYKALLVLVANSIGIMNLSTSEPIIIPAATLFTFNKILVLGQPPETAAEGVTVAATSTPRKTLLDVMADMRAAKK